MLFGSSRGRLGGTACVRFLLCPVRQQWLSFLDLGPGLALGPFVFTVLPAAPLCKNAKRSANALFRLSTYLFVCVCGCSCLADRTQEERRSVGNSYAACVRNLWIKSKQRNLFGHEANRAIHGPRADCSHIFLASGRRQRGLGATNRTLELGPRPLQRLGGLRCWR